MSKIEGHLATLATLVETKRPSTQISVYVHTVRRPTSEELKSLHYLGVATKSVGQVFSGFCTVEALRVLNGLDYVCRIRLVDEPDPQPTPPKPPQMELPSIENMWEMMKAKDKPAKGKAAAGHFVIFNTYGEDV